MYAIAIPAPQDFPLPHLIMQVRQCFASSEKQLMRIELALKHPA